MEVEEEYRRILRNAGRRATRYFNVPAEALEAGPLSREVQERECIVNPLDPPHIKADHNRHDHVMVRRRALLASVVGQIDAHQLRNHSAQRPENGSGPRAKTQPPTGRHGRLQD